MKTQFIFFLCLVFWMTNSVIWSQNRSETITFKQSNFDLYHISIDSSLAQHFEFVVNDSLLKLADFVKLQDSVRKLPFFAINGGIIEDKTFKPKGLFTSGGKELSPIDLGDGPGNFYLKPNGVFAVDSSGKVVVMESEAFVIAAGSGAEGYVHATQSGPMLVIGGQVHPKFNAGSVNKFVRCGVGISSSGSGGGGTAEVIFAISEAEVNLHDFASLFLEELGCKDALCLGSDGCVMKLPFLDIGSGDGVLGSFVLYWE